MARRCDVTGKGMNEGYIFNDNYYACDEEAAKQYVTSLGYNWGDELKKINTADEWFYWTKWEQVDPEKFYDPQGKEWNLTQLNHAFKESYNKIKEAITKQDFKTAYKYLELLINLNDRG